MVLSTSKKIAGFGLSLASMGRNGEMVDVLRLKGFSYYQVLLLNLSVNTYLVDSNFDDESFSGEGKILRKYLTPYKDRIFLVDKAICQEIGALHKFILNRHMRQFVDTEPVYHGDFLFEFSNDAVVEKFDALFGASFGVMNSSIGLLREAMPAWKEIIRPNVLKKQSIFMSFIALGEQMQIVGPDDEIHLMHIRAKALGQDWQMHDTFLDRT